MTTLRVAVLMLVASVSWADFSMAPGAAFPRQDQSAVLEHPEIFQGIGEVEGKVLSIDFNSRVILLTDSLGHTWQIHVGPDTPISDITRGNLQLSELAKDQTVHIYFDTHDMTARQIDRVSQGILGALLSAS